MIHNKPGAPLSRYIGPHPLNEDAHTKVGCGKKLQVHGGPGKPGRKPADLDLAALQDGESLADYCQVSFVEVPKGSWRRRTGNTGVNQSPRITSLLYGHLRYTRKWFAVLIEKGSIAYDKNLGMAGHCQVILDLHPAAAISLHSQPFAGR